MTRWLLPLLLVVAGCFSARSTQETTPDDQFGHRYEGEAPDGRQTIAIDPVDNEAAYNYYPATFDSVTVRPAPLDVTTGQEIEVEVEVLIKGAFPDACLQLHSFTQERTGNIITASLDMRRQEGKMCASVYRPYRFYSLLTGAYAAGNYTLKLNGKAIPFHIRAPSQSG